MNEPRALDDIEQVATQVLKTVAGLKARKTYLPGERSGAWRVFKPAS